MAKIENTVVMYYPQTGEVLRENPLPPRALQERASSPKAAASACGVGPIKWSVVESYTKKDLKDFQERYQVGELLATNAKTIKPRPSGRLGVIRGLNLSPHFYPNLLHEINVDADGHLNRFDRRWFNSFDGATPMTAAEGAKVPAKDLLSFCTGASQWCRQTCLVLTGQHPSTLEASRAKMKFTYALLSEPELFVALLHKQLGDFARGAARRGYDAVCRLNMLSDLPWYVICPELLEAHEEHRGAPGVTFYDYTKVKYWGTQAYERVRKLLDLTFSYSGSNDALCAEALDAGERIAVVFAPGDASRRATVSARTTWAEIRSSSLVDDSGEIALFGGHWPIVDGDSSDYRIDDPQPSIVALNFKEPTAQSPRLEAALPESRKRFGVAVPTPHDVSERYVAAKGRRAFWKAKGIDPGELPPDEAIALSELGDDDTAWDDVPVDAGALEPLREGVGLPMSPIKGTDLLVGPHVPTMLND